MPQGGDTRDTPTRRDYLKGGGAVIGGGLLAGCSGSKSETTTTQKTGTDSTTTTETESETKTSENGSYSVTMSPVGTVEFDAVPKKIFTRLSHHTGMAFALGRGDDVNAVNGPEYYDTTWNQFTPRLPGVSVDWSDLYPSWEVSKEKLYALDSDVHLADPASVIQLDNWNMKDIDEIADNIAPWFGNSLSAREQKVTSEWTGDYQYYTLWEQFEKVAKVFREEKRYEALASVHDDLLATIRDGLPPKDDRPSVAMITAGDVTKQIWAYPVVSQGFLTAHTRPLRPKDAFGGSVDSGATVDLEAMLEANPDVILFLGGMQPDVSMNDLRSTLESDPVAAKISAVENGHVYPQGARYQGPILNLFQLEMSAKQFYPDQFGEWSTSDGGPYPEFPEDEQLFDRQEVADIIKGNF
ncbi:ABC transporter substrate-binding protein [Haladaptatus sp. R4]|uniref:ABC transporter substrate-binding protein n=1 Tax=Haladaptatus sp. R4 TaxID=1679489 RepID=UPI0007B4E6D5|nr:ABC transporter substrate-binding protein [Haladaptatus sp. R4]KZN23350.1 ABC transporter substrate-binding protein [Haladaptatus sp. R4]